MCRYWLCHVCSRLSPAPSTVAVRVDEYVLTVTLHFMSRATSTNSAGLHRIDSLKVPFQSSLSPKGR
jgi:hypothetical protein